MKPSSIFIFVLVMLFPVRAVAQQWTSQQQEVINSLTACWDTWMEGVQSGSPDGWLDRCTAEGYTYWWKDGAPAGAQGLRRDWANIKTQDLGWVDLRPLVVKILGDVAIVQFYGYWKAPSAEGPVTTEWKRTEVFQKVNNRWLLVAGHSSPGSAEDLAPYKGIS